MQIGLVIGEFNPRRGGAELWTFALARRLSELGHQVHVVAETFGEQSEDLPIIRHRLQSTRSRLAFAAAAEEKLKTLTLDIVHDQGMGWYSDILTAHSGAWQASTEAKAAALPKWAMAIKRASLHVLPRYRTFRRLAARQFSDPGRIVHALSHRVADDFQRLHSVKPEQIRVVYNGIDTEKFSPLHRDRWREPIREQFGIADNDVLFLFVGNDYHRKGLPLTIEGLDRLHAQGRRAHLLVVGGKPYRRVPYRLKGEKNLVHFTGQVDDPLPYYAAADVFVLPTLYDPFGLSVLEAAACSLPCITTRAAGVAELFSDERDAYLLADPLDAEALTQHMKALTDDPERRREMGEAARKTAKPRTVERNCEELMEIYREILSRKSP